MTSEVSAREVAIAPVSEGKGRTFRSSVLGFVEARGLWDGGSGGGDVIRPCWALFAGSEQEIRPFVANALAGRKMSLGDGGYRRHTKRLELLKSARYEVAWQREVEGSLATVFLPDLFRVDPGMVDPAGAKFIVLARRELLASQAIDDVGSIARHAMRLGHRGVDEDLARALVPMAFLFVVYLDRRTRCPIYADGRFYLQLLLAFLASGAASFARLREGYNEPGFGQHSALVHADDLAPLGIDRPIGFSASHEIIEQTLAEQTTLFFDLTED